MSTTARACGCALAIAPIPACTAGGDPMILTHLSKTPLRLRPTACGALARSYQHTPPQSRAVATSTAHRPRTHAHARTPCTETSSARKPSAAHRLRTHPHARGLCFCGQRHAYNGWCNDTTFCGSVNDRLMVQRQPLLIDARADVALYATTTTFDRRAC